jgi:hypothetical protein
MKEERSFLNAGILVLVVCAVVFGTAPYSTAHEIGKISMSPKSPAELLDNERVNIQFIYVTEEEKGVRIFVFPYTKGRLTPNCAVSPSPLYPVGEGEGSGYFTILSSDIVVDQVKFQMTNADQSVLLLEFFIPVKYRYCDGTCVWHVDADAPGANTGTDWMNAFHYLQDALESSSTGR